MIKPQRGERDAPNLFRDPALRNLLFLTATFCALVAVAAAQVTAIRAGNLIDPESGTVLTDQVILIRDDKIEKLGPTVAIPPDARIIDLSKMTVLPGLIDCHTHLADGAHDGEPLGQ